MSSPSVGTNPWFDSPQLAARAHAAAVMPVEIDGFGVAHVAAFEDLEGGAVLFGLGAGVVVGGVVDVELLGVGATAASFGEEFVEVPGVEMTAVLGILG